MSNASKCPDCRRVLPKKGERCSCRALRELRDAESEKPGGRSAPAFPHADEVESWRSTAPRGLRGTGEIKARRDTDRHPMAGTDTSGRSLEPTDDWAPEATGRAEKSRAEPLYRTGPVRGRDGKLHRTRHTFTREQYDGLAQREEARGRDTPSDQGGGTSRRIDRGAGNADSGRRFERNADWVDHDPRLAFVGDLESEDSDDWAPDVDLIGAGTASLESFGVDPYADGDDSPPNWAVDLGVDDWDDGLLPPDLGGETEEPALVEHAEVRCDHCGGGGILRKGLCDACRKYQKRHRGELPTAEVLQRRQWARTAPIVTG